MFGHPFHPPGQVVGQQDGAGVGIVWVEIAVLGLVETLLVVLYDSLLLLLLIELEAEIAGVGTVLETSVSEPHVDKPEVIGEELEEM